ncbi:MAG: hypothetical protein Q9166_005396 [cf. Caloplaca sp. 2 TL-2023]
MPANKDRLYVALYARGGGSHREPGSDATYHWALMVGQKGDDGGSKGWRFHAKNPKGATDWIYEELELAKMQTGMLLARIVIAKITDFDRLKAAMRSVEIVQGDPSWTCIKWVENALTAIQADGKAVGTSVLDWVTVRNAGKKYVEEKKKVHRYKDSQRWDINKSATFDLLEGKEIVP